jgi:hypothetical protein
MTEKEFIVWLKGYFEIQNPKEIPEKETQIIRDHLETFFKKVTPERHEIKIIESPAVPPGNIVLRPANHGPLCTCVKCNGERMLIKQQIPKCLICGGRDHGNLPCPHLAVTC